LAAAPGGRRRNRIAGRVATRMGAEALAQIAAEIGGCTRCPLHAGRTRTVPGEGNPLSDVLLVGEGPGAREDVTGRPFVGPAGQLLDELLRSIGRALHLPDVPSSCGAAPVLAARDPVHRHARTAGGASGRARGPRG